MGCLSACADTTIVLDSDQNGKTLYVRGRDVEEKETAVIFVTGAWSIIGNVSDARRSDERVVILGALTDHKGPMTPTELAAITGQPNANVRQLLLKMAKSGEVHKLGRGRYWVQPVDPDNNDHDDNK
jgi:IclR helix-turn-helix domain